MTSITLNNAIKEIKSTISFVDYLPYLGYKREKKYLNDYTSFVLIQDEKEIDVVNITNIDGVEKYHSLSFDDSGDILNFVINRLEHKLIQEEGDEKDFNPHTSTIVRAVKHLALYGRIHGESNHLTKLKTTTTEFNAFQSKSFSNYYQILPLEDLTYFKSLMIYEQTLEHPIFKNRIFNSFKLKVKNTTYDTFNVAFPLVNSADQEKGLYYENHIVDTDKNTPPVKIQFFAKHSDKNFFWISNQGPTKKIINVIVTSSPVEALAHFQYAKTGALYISLFDLNQNTISQLKRVLARNLSKLNLCMNVNTNDSLKELRIIASLASKPIQIVDVSPTEIQVHISKTYGESLKKLLDYVKDYSKKNVSRSVNILGDTVKPYLKTSLIKAHTDKDHVILFCPKNYTAIYNLSYCMLRTLEVVCPIRISKPKYNNWIDQNRFLQDSLKNDVSQVTKHLEDRETFSIRSLQY